MPQALQPKVDFIAGSPARALNWFNQCGDPALKEAIAIALLEFTARQNAALATDAAACYYRIEGARKFIHVLLNLGEVEKDPSNATRTPQLE